VWVPPRQICHLKKKQRKKNWETDPKEPDLRRRKEN
jgi:hypothetical protein